MNCKESPQWISDWMDGALQPLEERMLMAHLEQCPECAALWEQLTALHTACSDLPELSAHEGFAQGVMARIREEGTPKMERKEPQAKVVPLFRRKQVRALAGMAACAVLCFGLGRIDLMTNGKKAEGAPMVSMPMMSAPMELERVAPMGIEVDSGMEEVEGVMPAAAPESTVVEDCVEEANASQLAVHDVILTLESLPLGWEEILGAETDWQTVQEGLRVCTVTREQGEAMLALALEQGIAHQIRELTQEQMVWEVQIQPEKK